MTTQLQLINILYIYILYKHLYLGTRFTAVYQVYSRPSITAHHNPSVCTTPFTVHFTTPANRNLPETGWYRVFFNYFTDKRLHDALITPTVTATVCLFPSLTVSPPRHSVYC